MTKKRAQLGSDISDILRGSASRDSSEAVERQTSKTVNMQNGETVKQQNVLPVKQQNPQAFEKATFYLAPSDVDLLHEERLRRRKGGHRVKRGSDNLSALVRHAIRQTYGNPTS